MIKDAFIAVLSTRYTVYEHGCYFGISSGIELSFGTYLTLYAEKLDGQPTLHDSGSVTTYFEQTVGRDTISDIAQKNGLRYECGYLMKELGHAKTAVKDVEHFLKTVTKIIKTKRS